MYFLALSIICSTLNHLIFKAFERWRISLLSAVVANFCVCVLVGYISLDKTVLHTSSLWDHSWLVYALIQGCLFMSSFPLMGLTTQRSGIGVAALSSRLAVVIPILAAFVLYGDSLSFFKLVGILGAVLALYLGSVENKGLKSPGQNANPLLPLSLFTLFGITLTFVKYVQAFHLGPMSYHSYITFAFASASSIGLMIMAYGLIKGTTTVGPREIGAGALLGLNNYCSVYFLIRALGQDGWESSVIFPTQSVSVVLLSFLGGFVLFRESVSYRKRIAVAIGLAAILCINH